MTLRILFASIILAVPAFASADAQSTAIARTLIDREIRMANDEGKTDATVFTSDADLINAGGPYWRGREEIARNTAEVIQTNRPKLAYELLSAEPVGTDLILAITRSSATIPAGPQGPITIALHQTRLLKKENGVWRVRLLQSTPVR